MEILILVILILLNGFFSLSEIALVSSRRTRLEMMKNQGSKGAAAALDLLRSSGNFLSAIQIGITLVGIITGMYGGLSLADDIAPLFLKFDLTAGSAAEISLTITVLVITYFSIVLGELVPKTISLSNPEKIAVIIAPLIRYFTIFFYPVVRFLSLSTSFIDRLLGIKQEGQHITEADLRQLLKTASSEGVIETDQNLIHQKLFYFSDKKAKHIMTHRREVEWIDLSQPYGILREAILKAKHTRLVCCRETLDNFQGILNVRDYLLASLSSNKPKISTLVTQPLFLPESADAQKVLNHFKNENTHICVVVNEYGIFEGIITLHDILENLIGTLPEEGVIPEPDIFVRDEKSFLISGDAPAEILDTVFENHVTDLENVDYTTVAGFVLRHINKIPQIGDKFTYANYVIEIVDIDGNRIDKIEVTRL
jgi:putative hemolysin